jgi:hypothetical protein
LCSGGSRSALEIERLSGASDSYLFHEHLEHTNQPIYFYQFIERAERAGLMYLSEASISDMLSSHFQQPVAETLERISPDMQLDICVRCGLLPNAMGGSRRLMP